MRYTADIEFEDGRTTLCDESCLKRLKKRIKNDFKGEVTDWGYAPNSRIKKVVIYDNHHQGSIIYIFENLENES